MNGGLASDAFPMLGMELTRTNHQQKAMFLQRHLPHHHHAVKGHGPFDKAYVSGQRSRIRPPPAMGDREELFKVTVAMKREDDDGQVYYKSDGQRFDVSNTIKMNVEAQYAMTVTFRPSQTLERAVVMGVTTSVKEMSHDHLSSTYALTWPSMGAKVTKKGQRYKLPMELEIAGHGTLSMGLQVKFYKAEDKHHCTWGTALHHIDLDCKSKPSLCFVDIMKETFR